MEKLSTQPYKGTRDFYPEDMAVQRYIFETWSKAAELFGYTRFDASILEPSDLYKSKGAENEELVNEQTYTFNDRGDREVTLRPEMTPTTARMVAAKRRELTVPIRWYSIPNLFRYERPQRGRLREHWQLNCDIFGVSDVSADVEIIALAHHVLTAFGATDDMFEIRINHRGMFDDLLRKTAKNLKMELTDEDIAGFYRLRDRQGKMPAAEYDEKQRALLGEHYKEFVDLLEAEGGTETINSKNKHAFKRILDGLNSLGIKVIEDHSIARGFDYYTGTVFEFFDTSKKNNRSLLGGGRYDNLTALFGGDPIPGVGFGMGDVTMRDFLETHKLLPDSVRVTAPKLFIIPTDIEKNVEAEKLAQHFRKSGIATAVDLSDRRVGKKIKIAVESGTKYILTLGEDELKSGSYTLKELSTKSETTGTRDELVTHLS